MASKMAVIFKAYYFYVRTSSEQAEIFGIGPEKSVEQHTKSPGESLQLSKKFKMASKMDIIFKEYYLYVRTSSEQAEIFRIGPEKLVEQHTNSSDESLWSSPRIQDGVQNGRQLSK